MFNVINYNINTNKMEKYDIFPHLINCYKNKKKKDRPVTFEEFREFIKIESLYMWWSRCEYEIILSDWPNKSYSEKWDIHKQVMMNLDVITKLFMDKVLKK